MHFNRLLFRTQVSCRADFLDRTRCHLFFGSRRYSTSDSHFTFTLPCSFFEEIEDKLIETGYLLTEADFEKTIVSVVQSFSDKDLSFFKALDAEELALKDFELYQANKIQQGFEVEMEALGRIANNPELYEQIASLVLYIYIRLQEECVSKSS